MHINDIHLPKTIILIAVVVANSAFSQTNPDTPHPIAGVGNQQPTNIQGGLQDYSIEVVNPSVWKIMKSNPEQKIPGDWDMVMYNPPNHINFHFSRVQIYGSTDQLLEAGKQSSIKGDPNVQFLSTNTITLDGVVWKKVEQIMHNPDGSPQNKLAAYAHSGIDGTYLIMFWTSVTAPESDMIMMDKIVRSWKRGAVMVAEDKKINDSADKPLFEVDNSTDYPTSRILGSGYNYSIEIPALKSNQIERGNVGDLAVAIPELSGFNLVVRASRIYEGDISTVLDKIKKTFLTLHPDAEFSSIEKVSVSGEKWMRASIRFPSGKLFIRTIVYSGDRGTVTLTGGVGGNPVDEVKYTPVLDKVEESFKFYGDKN